MVELLERSFSTFDLKHEFNFANNIKNRGVSDIPKYWFRDDGLKLWNAIQDYAKKVIDIVDLSDDEDQTTQRYKNFYFLDRYKQYRYYTYLPI